MTAEPEAFGPDALDTDDEMRPIKHPISHICQTGNLIETIEKNTAQRPCQVSRIALAFDYNQANDAIQNGSAIMASLVNKEESGSRIKRQSDQ